MSLPNVIILLQNGQLGGVASFAEGVAGIIGTGEAVTSKIQIGDPRLVFSLPEAEAIGITEADNAEMYRQVKEFYDEAGTGKELYIMIVADTMSQTQMADKTNANGVVKLLNYAQGRIRLWGSYYAPADGYTPVLTTGVDGDLHTAIVKAHATCEQYADAIIPCRSILEAREFTGDAADLTDLHTYTYNRVGVVLGGSDSTGASSSVGTALGRLAKIPVQRKISRKKDKAVSLLPVYIGTADAKTYAQTGLIHDKGYITFRPFPANSGLFFNRDWVAAPLTDDYATISRGRVIDKAAVIAYLTYLEELDDEVLIEAGKLAIGAVKFLEEQIEEAIKTAMQSKGEISGVTATIDPDQNLTTTEELEVELGIDSVAYNGTIKVKLGFKSPNS